MIFNDKMAENDTISIIEISNDVGVRGGGARGKKCSIGDQQKSSMHEYESSIF